MKPLRDDPASPPELARLLDAARAVPEAPPGREAEVWRRIAASAEARGPRRPLWLIAAPALAAFALTVVIAPRFLRPGRADAAPAVVAAPGAALTFEGSLALLRSGAVRAGPGARVRTPQLEVEVGMAHCLVQVAGEVTTVEVQDGEVRVRRGDGPVVALSGGMRLRSDDPRLRPAPPVPTPAVPTPAAKPLVADPCAAASDRRACLARVAVGDDLAAQNALYLLGQLESDSRRPGSAIAYWRSYAQRFPDGALWPEATAGMLAARLDQADWAGALAAADAFLARVPQGGRAPEVRLVRANLLREHLHHPRQALQAYRALADSDAPAALRGEARFGEALAARELGLAAEARAALDAYARDFPQGPHAAEVARMRAP